MLAHIDGASAAPIHHLAYLLYILMPPFTSILPCSKVYIYDLKKIFFCGFICRLEIPGTISWELHLLSCLQQEQKKTVFPVLGPQKVLGVCVWESNCESSITLTDVHFFFFYLQRAHSALSLGLCRAALRLLSHPLLLLGRTSSQSGAVTHIL